MVDTTKQCKLSHEMMIRLNNFLYVFNLRQGTILIAVHQIVSNVLCQGNCEFTLIIKIIL